MEKSINKHKTYNTISKHEAAFLSAVEEFLVFSPNLIKKRLRWKSTRINNTLISLKKKKLVTALKKNYYVVTSKIPENLFKIATTITSPSYISFWTASSYYGLTEQQVKTIQVVSTKQYPNMVISDFTVEVTTYSPKKFYGYHTMNNFSMVEKEKLIIDLLYKPEKGGGMDEVRKCIQNMWSEVNERRLLAYIKKFNNKSLFARLGYLLDELRLKNNLEDALQKNILLSYVKLNSQKKATQQINKKWRVIVND